MENYDKCNHGFIRDDCLLCSATTRKEAALKKIEEEYYNPESPHYKDNERYKWATGVIEKNFK